MRNTISRHATTGKRLLVAVSFLSVMLWLSTGLAAPAPELWPRWQAHSAESTAAVDHTPWDLLLKKYVVTNHPSGINRFRYAAVSPADRLALRAYLDALQQVKVSGLKRAEQKAYWVNLYNALTVKVVLDHYPVKSIMDIDISPGLFSQGPWDAKLLTIEGEKVSLNDIEHRILRPIFKDNRLHYALNCASLGCPDLQPQAFTAANMDWLLNMAAKAYVNSLRGARLVDGRLHVSSIYIWFQVDFGGSDAGVIEHLRRYAVGTLAQALSAYDKGLSNNYDWNLNEQKEADQ